ncbi:MULTISPECIES: deiodinase-like protein [unclassified Imperialibacter]|uniref:TlpA family protein disulfide reductase n=1 Tax=unclassified Imperialibacter TaxID=2629706 RepID=UPI001869B1DF|nr:MULTISPECIES: deiodinase-like protein [unclassified Imperialibacter]
MKVLLATLLFFLFSFTTPCDDKPVPPCDEAETVFQTSAIMSAPWVTLGYLPGKEVPSLTLFDTERQILSLTDDSHKKTKPLLIVTGSYTCDISRKNLPSLLHLEEKFGSKVDIMIVYTMDAHPYDSPSPYSPTGEVSIAMDNVRNNIKAEQPKTYKERVELAKAWVRENAISVPIFIDNPQNEFWWAFGQGPNMCYLINTEGKVAFRELWFNERNTKKAIRNLLNQPKY